MKPATLLLVLPLLSTPPGVAATVADSPPDLAGTWILDRDASDDPREVMRRSRGSRGGFGGPPGGGPGGSGRGGPGGSRGGRGRGVGEGSGDPARAVARIEIEHSDALFVVRDANGIERLFSTDESERIGPEGELVHEATWKKDGRLVTRRETAMGGEMTETYELSEDGSRLFVTAKGKGGGRMPAFELRRVYDRADEAAEE